ncbi:MAG: hypothetical protein RIM23_25215 [Coleofasciculus sp. G3-WIS-01]|uniref:hypothetical protein n=1 Tax=Coleofasciculus sp. G3-WIS-01 TaxID=3069528 RepID=UPI0032FBEAE3
MAGIANHCQLVVAWHTLFDELQLYPETVGAHGVRPIQWSHLSHNFSCVSQ